MSEFNEPWRIYDHSTSDRYGEIFLDCIAGKDRLEIPSGSVAKRIAACVNACAGIPTEALDRARQFMPTLAANFTPEQKAKLLEELSKAGPGEVVALPDQVEYSPARLKWRKEPPDKPGWWLMWGEWTSVDGAEVRTMQAPEVVRVVTSRGGRRFVRPTWDDFDGTRSGRGTRCKDVCVLWAGPIEPPETKA